MSNIHRKSRFEEWKIRRCNEKLEVKYNAVMIRSTVIIAIFTLLDHSLFKDRNSSSINIFCYALQTSVFSFSSTKSRIVHRHINSYTPVQKRVKSTINTNVFMVLQSGDWETRKRERRKHDLFSTEEKKFNYNTTAANRSGSRYYPAATVTSNHPHRNISKDKCHGQVWNHQSASKRKQATKRFNQLLQKITKKRTVDATKKAESLILRALEQNSKIQKVNDLSSGKFRERLDLSLANPDTVSFNIVLSAWTKVRTKGGNSGLSVCAYCAEQAQSLFEKMHSVPNIVPDTYSYGAIMNAIAKSGEKGAAARVHQLLLKLEQERPDEVNAILYNILLDALAREASLLSNKVNIHDEKNSKANFYSNDDYALKDSEGVDLLTSRDLALKAEDVLNQMENYHLSSANRGKSKLNSNTISYNSCMKAWVNVGTAESAKRVESLLQRMMSSKNLELRPNTRTISTIISCYAQIGDPQKAEDMLYQMESGNVWGEQVSPDVVTYTTVISAWAKTGHLKGTQKALTLLQSMVQGSSSKKRRNTDIAPNTITYNTVLLALANYPLGANVRFCPAEKAEELLDQMRGKGNTPDTITFSTVMDIYGNQGDKTAALRAEKLLETMEYSWLELGHDNARPNVITYSAAIRCWAQVSNDNTAPQRATAILNRLEQLYFETKNRVDYAYSEALKPNKIIYNTVIECWSKSKSPDAVEAIEDLLKRMERLHEEEQLNCILPDATTYSFVINAWTKSCGGDDKQRKDSALRVEKLLSRLEISYKQGEKHMKPTSLLYSAVAQAYAKMACKEGAKKAETLLRRNQKMYRDNPKKNAHMRPTSILFNAVIDAFARSGDIASAEKAQSILHELIQSANENNYNQDLYPSTRSFNAAILAWKNCGNPKLAHEKSEILLKLMNEMYKNGNKLVKPDKCTINSYIGVLAKVGKAQKADDFLMHMEKMYVEKGDITYKPDMISFNTCIDAWANSSVSEDDVSEKINSLLNRLNFMMEYQDNLKPDMITLYSLLKAKRLLQFIKPQNKNELSGEITIEGEHKGREIRNKIESNMVLKHTASEKIEQLLSTLLIALNSKNNEMGFVFKKDQTLLKLFIDVLTETLQQQKNSEHEKKLEEILQIYNSLKHI